MKYQTFLILAIIFTFAACKTPMVLVKHDFPRKVDTTTRPIEYQEKKTYTVGNISVTNEFPAARLNDFTQLDDSTFQATISAENTPINESPWYAFKIWTTTPRSIYLKLHYTEHEHRYHPKLSRNGEEWTAMDSSLVVRALDSIDATVKIEIDTDTLWFAAQEIQDHQRVGKWVQKMGESDLVTLSTAGNSVQGRSIYHMTISKGPSFKKPAVIVISRQHPPEVTGFFAMKAFIETIINEGRNNGFLDKFKVMVYPLMNPDGVDLGNYRHNTGGIDMNRDWANYHQPENRQVVNHMVNQTVADKNNVILGLDFHSTYYDIYYTNDSTVTTKIPGFTKEWLKRIEIALNLDDINERASGANGPTSKGWFNAQFGAESVTYEIGDDTPRDFIKIKGEVSADAMMSVLLEKRKEWKLRR